MHMRFIGALAGVFIGLSPAQAGAAASADAAPPSRAVLVLEQSTSFRAFPAAIVSRMRSTLMGGGGDPIDFYVEHLDLYRFGGPHYASSVESYFRDKYQDVPIGVIVAIGPAALEYGLGVRAVLWPAVPLVFGAVEEEVAAQEFPDGVTGTS